MTKISEEQFKQAVKDSYGNRSTIARKLGVTAPAIYTRLKNNPKWQDYIDNEKEMLLDLAEGELTKIISKSVVKDSDKLSAIKFLLEKLGIRRGYGLITTNRNLNVNVDHPMNAKNMNKIYYEILEENKSKEKGFHPNMGSEDKKLKEEKSACGDVLNSEFDVSEEEDLHENSDDEEELTDEEKEIEERLNA